jgi:hypothetical protein
VSFAGRRLTLGLWTDHLSFDHTVFGRYGVDNCSPENTISSLLSGGLFIRYSSP